jgi:uncharacterized membrane protein YphA (DoxX/SURF4 family)
MTVSLRTRRSMPVATHDRVAPLRAAELEPQTARLTVYAIVFLRVAFGLWFLWHEAIEKFQHWTPQTLPRVIATWTRSDGYGFYQSFLREVAAPNADLFRFLVTWWELALALCLIFGLGIRVVAPVQIFANLNYILAKTYASPQANLDRLTIMILVVLFLVSAGRYWGVDGYLRRRFPRLSWL